jgi:hypothetical protein
MNELDASLRTRLQGTAITSRLAGTNSIYHHQAPENETMPFIVWNIQGGGDENLDANRTKNHVLFIRAYSGNTAAQAGSVDAQIDAALHLSPLTVSGWTNIWLSRIQDIETAQLEPNGKIIYSAGGLYRCHLDKE